MNINLAALQYLHQWDIQQPISEGVAFEALLRKQNLDYSVQSLARVDTFLDELREGRLIQAGAVSQDGSVQSLFYLLAFYVGEVIARSVRSAPQWLSYDDYNEQFPGDPSVRCFDTSIVLTFLDNPQVRAPIFKPLISIISRALEDNIDKSVRFSAGAQIPVDMQTGPASEQPLAQLPARAWPVDIGTWLQSATAADLDAMAVRVPLWGQSDDLNRLFCHTQDLLFNGRVVWGAVIQANSQLFDPLGLISDGGAPAEVLYDPHGRAPWDGLVDVARNVFACRGKTVDDVSERKQDFVNGRYPFAAPPLGAVAAVKVSSTCWVKRALFC